MSRRLWGATGAVVLIVAALVAWRYTARRPADPPMPELSDPDAADRMAQAWNGERAMEDIRALLAFTPRSPGTPGQKQTLEYIRRELSRNPQAVLSEQAWTHRRDDGVELPMTNVIARLWPGKVKRVLLGTHHDGIIRAYKDRANPNGLMPGANNSASGVALLLETSRALMTAGVEPDAGVDLVFFDGEEGDYAMGGGRQPWRPVGSPYFVERMPQLYPGRPPGVAIVFDLVCRKDLLVRPEPSSLERARTEMDNFWAIGRRVSPATFDMRPLDDPIGDDHTAFLHEGYWAFLVIDFRPTPWFNTTQDTIDKCSPRSLEAIGRTLSRYLYIRRPNP